MPETSDPMASVGYLVAAAAITSIGLAGYTLALIRRLSTERRTHADLTARLQTKSQRRSP
ncbi:MAG: hypothetical protein HW416_3788 [Chloroflexi bacterium]|nr:hypothetical protein [Chloroflexota bacterium]